MIAAADRDWVRKRTAKREATDHVAATGRWRQPVDLKRTGSTDGLHSSRVRVDRCR